MPFSARTRAMVPPPAPAPTTTTSYSLSAIPVSTASKLPSQYAPTAPGRSYWAEAGNGSGRLLTTPS